MARAVLKRSARQRNPDVNGCPKSPIPTVKATSLILPMASPLRLAPELAADAPHDYVMQLALYRAVVRRLYPAKPVAAAILWTDRPSLMEIPSVLLDLAEMQAAASPAALEAASAPRDGLPP